jgi:hypothetical protein
MPHSGSRHSTWSCLLLFKSRDEMLYCLGAGIRPQCAPIGQLAQDPKRPPRISAPATWISWICLSKSTCVQDARFPLQQTLGQMKCW